MESLTYSDKAFTVLSATVTRPTMEMGMGEPQKETTRKEYDSFQLLIAIIKTAPPKEDALVTFRRVGNTALVPPGFATKDTFAVMK